MLKIHTKLFKLCIIVISVKNNLNIFLYKEKNKIFAKRKKEKKFKATPRIYTKHLYSSHLSLSIKTI